MDDEVSEPNDPRAHVPEDQLTPDELLEVVGPSWDDVKRAARGDDRPGVAT